MKPRALPCAGRCPPGANRWLLAAGLAFLASLRQTIAADFAPGAPAGQITNSLLTDLSGIVASQRNPGVLWVHNDLARPQIHAVSTNGQLLATWNLGQPGSDFEDIALGPGPVPELQYLYCGDIGDNAAARPGIQVFRVAEPAVYAYQAANPLTRAFPQVERFALTYPDSSHNAEELMVDPLSGDLYIATKEPNRSRIYRAEAGQLTANGNAKVILSFVQQIDFHVVSAGDIRSDGLEIILRQEEFAKTWRRAFGQTIAEALAGTPEAAPVIGLPTEPNGEGITFAGDGLGYYTISEGINPVIYFFARTNGGPRFQTRYLVEPASAWAYWDHGSEPGVAWRNPGFNDSVWPVGNGQLGYGEGDERTVLSFGPNPNQKHVSTYFRGRFHVENLSNIQSLALSVVYDDGIAVYLNGVEVLRRELAPSANPSDLALASSGTIENVWRTFAITNVLRAGENLLAVEVHRASVTEEDLSFDLQLLAVEPRQPPLFVTPIQRTGKNAWTVEFQTANDDPIILEKSTDLRTWTASETLVPGNRRGGFNLAPIPSIPAIFYRLRQ